jgi:hypothetical protein
LADPDDVRVVVGAVDDDDEDNGPAGTGEPVAHVVAPDALELQTLDPIVDVSVSEADCASPREPPASPVTHVEAAEAAAPTRRTATIAAKA